MEMLFLSGKWNGNLKQIGSYTWGNPGNYRVPKNRGGLRLRFANILAFAFCNCAKYKTCKIYAVCIFAKTLKGQPFLRLHFSLNAKNGFIVVVGSGCLNVLDEGGLLGQNAKPENKCV